MIVKLAIRLPEPDEPYCNGQSWVCQFLKLQLRRKYDFCALFEYNLKEKIIMGDGSESRDGNPLPVSRKIRCSKCIEACKKAEGANNGTENADNNDKNQI